MNRSNFIADRFLYGGSALVLAAFPITAQAEIIAPGVIATAACNGDEVRRSLSLPADADHAGKKWRKIDKSNLALIMSVTTGHIVSQGEATAFLRQVATTPSAVRGTAQSVVDLQDTYAEFQDDVAAGSVGSLMAFDRTTNTVIPYSQLNDAGFWMLDADKVFRCKLPDTPPPAEESEAPTTDARPGVDEKAPIISFGKLKVRGNIEALALSGEARKKADAATIGLERIRAFKDDGTRTETTTWSVKSVVGVPIIEKANISGLTIYGGYELSRARVVPEPVLVPPATQRDGDTEVIKAGLVGYSLIALGKEDARYSTSLDLVLDAGYLFDLANNTERFRAKISGDLYTSTDLGFCRLGDYRDWGRGPTANSGLYTRCDVTLISDFNVLTDRGKLLTIKKKSFGYAGAKIKFGAAFGKTPVTGPFFSAEYQHLRRIRGDALFIPHVKRHELTIGHRWWSSDDFGLEVTGNLVDGENPDSLEDENKVTIGFGVIF